MNVALHHRDLGGEGLPPLAILHGMLGSSRNWQMAGRDLASKFHVFALDLRNHGSSPHADEMTYPALAGDVVAWMQLRGMERVSILGHSLGGKVAMFLACRHPERVERLIAVDIAPKDYFWPARRREFAAMNALDLGGLRSRAEAERFLEKDVPDRPMRKFIATNLERTEEGGWKWAVNLPVLTAAVPILEKNPLEPGDRYSGPTLVVTGGRSSYVTVNDAAAIAAHFSSARLEVIDTAGHNPHVETRERFVQIVLGGASDAL